MNKGKLKIADFGFAKVNVHKKIRNETCVGTPLYMSLAVLKCQGYTSKCDIWSIGCIFYEMLHGRTPWVTKSEYELVEAILNKPLAIDPKLNKRTQDFLMQTLQINEADRICWDDVFRHKIFKGYFDHYIDENNNF
jgi:serine/threonine protein kinase